MQKTVPVRVKKATELQGETYAPGAELTMPTMAALAAASRGLVKILRHLTAAPAPVKPKRIYKRRDLQAEGE